MDTRRALIELLRADRDTFHDRARAFLERHDCVDDRRLAALDADLPEFDGPPELPDYESHPRRTRDLVWRSYVLDHAPLGITLCGPAYRDTPIVYATRTTRRLTGYDLAALRGENPRLFQGPDTEAAAVADLREAIDIWEPVTADLWNYRRDGIRFRNRVSLVPLSDETGGVANWIGVQEVLDTAVE